MPQLDYYIVDVFCEAALAGNPLAVVMDTAGLDTDRMQSLAREFNLSETTFVQRRPEAIENAQGVRVRIFTTQEELAFAGHPTLGTASVLRLIAPETVREAVVVLEENVGQIPVEFQADRGALFGAMRQQDPVFGSKLDRAEVARLAGLRLEDLDPAVTPQIVSTGTAFAIVLLCSVEALGRLSVLQEEASPWLRSVGARWFYFLAPVKGAQMDGPRYRARMQFNGGEDPATGSAAGCAISYLAGHCLAPSGERIHVRQGVEMGRPSDLYLSASVVDGKVGEVRVSGSTVLVAKGQLFLP